MLKLDSGPVQTQGLTQTACLPTLFQLEREGFTPRGFGVPPNPPTFTSELPWFHPAPAKNGGTRNLGAWVRAGSSSSLPGLAPTAQGQLPHRGCGANFARKWFQFLKRRSLSREGIRWIPPGPLMEHWEHPQQILLSPPCTDPTSSRAQPKPVPLQGARG